MDVNSYYDFQAKARNLIELDQVLASSAEKGNIYKRIILPWLPKQKDAVIFEVGCGPGILLHWLNRIGYKNISGADSSKAQVKLAKIGGLNVKLIDAIKAMQNTRKDSIDCLIAIDFYEHLPKELLLDFLSEANRILKKGGCLVIRGPNAGSPFVGRALFNDITHFWCLTPIAFSSLFEMFGFKKTEYRDDTLASINRYRLFLVPLSWLAQQLVKKIIRLAIKEEIECLAASFYICTWK